MNFFFLQCNIRPRSWRKKDKNCLIFKETVSTVPSEFPLFNEHDLLHAHTDIGKHFPFLTRELRMRNTSYRELWENVSPDRSIRCKLYANEVRTRLSIKLQSNLN